MFFNSFNFSSNRENGIVGIGPVSQNISITNAGIADENRLVTVSYQFGESNGSFVSFNGVTGGTAFTRLTDTTSDDLDTDPSNPLGQQPVFAIGWDGNNNYAQADIAEIIVFDKALTACEAHKVNFFLSQKYKNDFWGPIPDSEPCLVDLFQKIKDYADGDGTSPAVLTVQSYINVSGDNVSAENLAAVNAAILAKSSSDINTVADVQRIIDESIIQNYADTNGTSKPVPTPEMYDSIGVTGVTDSNINQVNIEISGKTKEEVDRTAEVQAIVDAIGAFVIDLNPLNRNLVEGEAFAVTPARSGTPNGNVRWSVSGIDAALFLIDENTGRLTLKTPADFDTLTNNPIQVTITATDDGGNTDSKNLVLTILKDTDGDGTAAINDNDIDGKTDAEECPDASACNDNNDDTIPDYLDNDVDGSADPDTYPVAPTLGPTPTPEPSPAPGAGDNSGAQEPGKVKTGVSGAGNMSVNLLLVLALLVILGRTRRVRSFGLMLMAALPLTSHAEWWDEMNVYVGAGVGQSTLDPDTSDTNLDQKDDHDTGWKLTAGWDWNDHISIEGYYAELGNAKFRPQGSINYRMVGGDVIGHYWLMGEPRRQGSIALYAKGGLNHMTNDGKNLAYEKQEVAQLMLGAGAEYYLPKAFSLRLEFESYDKDASLLSLNLIKRFGASSQYQPAAKATEPQPVVAEVVEPAIAEEPVVEALVVEEVVVEKAVAAEPSIKDVDVIVADIGFAVNSSKLAEKEQDLLKQVAADIQQSENLQVEVQAHTDASGSAKYNEWLSQRRAESVAAFLIEQGVNAEQLTVVGYGESQPRASNETAEGRAQNCRVEFKVLQR